MKKVRARHGIKQRRVGDEFELEVQEGIKKDPTLLGLSSKAKCLFSTRTEGSRGEVDIVSMFLDNGNVIFPIIQAKRNGYLPEEDRKKLKALLKHIRGSSVYLFLGHYTSKKDWRCSRLLNEKDMLAPKRQRQWDNVVSDLDDKENKNRARSVETFEMKVISQIKDQFAKTGTMTNPEIKGHVPVFTIRLEEENGSPQIVCITTGPTGKPMFLMVYAYQEEFIPPEHRDKVIELFGLSMEHSDKCRLALVNKSTGTGFYLQLVPSMEELHRFFYI